MIDDLIHFLRARYAEERQTAMELRMQNWQAVVADVNAKQAIVDACERATILAAGATRKITDMTAAGVAVPTAELVDAARLEGQAAALSRALSVLAQPHARHPEYRQEWRPRG
ncbi:MULTISPECIES: DUF6221 family protein [unclassified Streptomyces]|uniref:DUF6221 family protein n=1 Tax=unclassified Streptomyces TaxID=2593676 RepID=UPI0036B8D80B